MVRPNLSFVVALISLNLGGQVANAQYSIYNASDLASSLGDSCIQALIAPIDCAYYTTTFAQPSYRGHLDLNLTDSICTTGCSASLKSWFDAVSTRCDGKSVEGAVPTKFGGYIWAGYNETCVRDPKPPRAYCNDVIANFTDVLNVQAMPRTELCHTCHVRRLALMQSSQYSIYDDYYKEELEYVYAQCGLKGPTAIPPALEIVQPEPKPYCLSNKRYTAKEGDTCESIANSTSVSAAALYIGNQGLIKECSKLTAAADLCLPMTCVTYYLRPSDTCFSIERSLSLDSGMVQQFNPWLDAECTNLQAATGFYGKVICASPQGGAFITPTTPPLGSPTKTPSDGYTQVKLPPPDGVPVAPGTTLQCGKWHVVASGDLCVKICLTNGIDTSLLHEVNPSLATGADCDASLKEKTALCAGPLYSWKTLGLSPSPTPKSSIS